MQQELSEIFDKNFEKIYRFFYIKTLSKEDAEDLTSETFLRFAQQLAGGQEVDKRDAYLYGIARFVFFNFLRKRYQLTTVQLNELHDVHQELVNVPQIDLLSFVLKLAERLPEKQRQVIELRLGQKLTLSEIAETLNRDMNYVKTTQKRAIHSLKQLVACTPLPTNM